MKWETKRAALLADATKIVDAAKSAGRGLTDSEKARLDGLTAEVKSGDQHAAKAAKDGRLFDAIAGLGRKDAGPSDGSDRLAVWPAASRDLAGRLAAKSADLSATIHPGAEMKSLLPAGGSVADSITVTPGLVQTPQVPTSFLELLTTIAVDSPNFGYLRQTLRDNKAAPVAPGGLKPTSEYSLERVEGALKVIAHLTEPVGKYDLLDIEALTRFLDSELRFGLFSGVEDQVLNGDGTGSNLTGLLATSGVQTQEFDVDVLTTLRRAVTKLENLGHQPTAVVVRPEDWEKVELSTSSGSGEFTFASSPIDRAARRVWGVQVAVSNALPVGSAVMLDTSTLALYTDRQGVAVEWSTSGDDFERNQVRARCEGRFSLGVFQPNGAVKVTTAAAG